MDTQLSLKQSFDLAWGRFTLRERLFVIASFTVSLGFTVYGILSTLWLGQLDMITILSIIMSVFGFIGTWTLALQWQHTFKVNGIQNLAGILVAGMQGIYGDMFTSLYYLITEFIGNSNWKNAATKTANWWSIKALVLKTFSLLSFSGRLGLVCSPFGWAVNKSS